MTRSSKMDYQQTIDYLFSRLPMFSRIGAAAYKNDLTNTIELCKYLDDPQNNYKSIHVAGTNGKGSVSHMLAAIFQTAGYRTGLYTSPHLKDFRERIKINNKWVSEEFIIEFTQKIQPLLEKIDPSFFEITVAMAFDYFSKMKVDLAIIEVGLGGRLDSTNIIDPELAVITNIGYDHMNILGDSLEKIAFEKAGIIKKGVPVVVGERDKGSEAVFEKVAAQLDAPLTFADQQRFVADWRFERHRLIAEVTMIHNNDKQHYQLDLTGLYQTKNLITVLEASHILKQQGWAISTPQIQKALSNVKHLTGLHGRWETVHESPMVILDVGHNEDGIRQITRQIEITDHENLHLVIGFVKDKEINSLLNLLPKQANYYFTKAQIPRALPEKQLEQMALEFGLMGNSYPFVMEAVLAALNTSTKKDLIVICGSVFVVGEVELNS
jgi:dihydrofolate synthase / folylpolyglutamate synthase